MGLIATPTIPELWTTHPGEITVVVPVTDWKAEHGYQMTLNT